MTGQVAYVKGQSAEDSVVRAYERSGFKILDRRWRVREGEIDIVAGHGKQLYFVEVKASRTFDRAAENLSARQQARIQNAALRYLADKACSLDVPCRFDAALVNETGQVKVIPGAYGH